MIYDLHNKGVPPIFGGPVLQPGQVFGSGSSPPCRRIILVRLRCLAIYVVSLSCRKSCAQKTGPGTTEARETWFKVPQRSPRNSGVPKRASVLNVQSPPTTPRTYSTALGTPQIWIQPASGSTPERPLSSSIWTQETSRGTG